MQCLIDNTEHETLDALHKHLRKFKVTQASYYEEYYPKSDMLTGEKIEFKSFDQYFSTFFANRTNMKKWFKENPDKNLALAIEMLKNRVTRKGLFRAPTEVELISSGLPSVQFYEGKSDYNEICKDFGVLREIDYKMPAPKFHDRKMKIIVDTRETKPFKFPNHEVINSKLDFGDYAEAGRENDLVVERKSLMDLIGSFVSNFDRVEREFQRARDNGAYLIVVCEESLNTAMSFNFIPYIRRYTKIRPEILFHNIRELIQKYGFQFVFCDGVEKATEVTEKILKYQGDIRKMDIQYMIDRRKEF